MGWRGQTDLTEDELDNMINEENTQNADDSVDEIHHQPNKTTVHERKTWWWVDVFVPYDPTNLIGFPEQSLLVATPSTSFSGKNDSSTPSSTSTPLSVSFMQVGLNMFTPQQKAEKSTAGKRRKVNSFRQI